MMLVPPEKMREWKGRIRLDLGRGITLPSELLPWNMVDDGAAILRAFEAGEFAGYGDPEEKPPEIRSWPGIVNPVFFVWFHCGDPMPPSVRLLLSGDIYPFVTTICETLIKDNPARWPNWKYLPCPCGRVIWRLR